MIQPALTPLHPEKPPRQIIAGETWGKNSNGRPRVVVSTVRQKGSSRMVDYAHLPDRWPCRTQTERTFRQTGSNHAANLCHRHVPVGRLLPAGSVSHLLSIARRGGVMGEKTTRVVYSTMVQYLAKGWSRVGNAYKTLDEAKGWLPFVRGAWRGCAVKVSKCVLLFDCGELSVASLRKIDTKYNIDAPAKEEAE